ncbi:putative ferredoxin/ferredoxin--NADP reductase [Nocardia cerradoensis]|uniref:ferredoxin--NADP(+) reductase n=1 Tax=Nocardia cerradoensis TaxID=85688 RepID=A0A231GT23_9NOCA|nr:FAD-dependent oxidoreductase [Nocardia cerradoensis]OXR39770.1 putative ferredoxin/ferredoxin--NADP reductase [Nocardia cerradoensis]
MAYVITQNCCNDASCLAACPVGCIHPTPDEPGFATAEMLYIDPDTCIDCGACADWCPVDAIKADSALTANQQPFRQLNADYYHDNPVRPGWRYKTPPAVVTLARGRLRVAIVGAGPAAWYCAKELLAQPDVEVSIFDRLPTPFGLVRHGVAPDHPATKRIVDQFRFDRDQARRLALFLNVEVGTHVTHADLMDHHHAVIYAHGAATDRRLDIAGEDLPGSLPATRLVAWYNGHPDHARLDPDLNGRRAVIIGNGNVALDIARLLTTDPGRLAGTDIADHALNALRHSTIEEVVIVGRRSAADAAFTTPELLALTQLTDVDVVLDTPITAEEANSAVDAAARRKLALLTPLPTAEQDRTPGRKRIVLRFNSTPVEIVGTSTVEGVVLATTETRVDPDGIRRPIVGDHTETLPAGLVIRSIGFKGTPLPDIPFDDATGTVPNQAGRVTESGSQRPLPGVYTAGWIKRGPTGVIGTNRLCAQQTVANLLEDFLADRLVTPRTGGDELARLVRSRQPDTVDSRGWSAIDTAERSAGAATQRPRRKFTDRDALLDAARQRPARRLPLIPARSA